MKFGPGHSDPERDRQRETQRETETQREREREALTWQNSLAIHWSLDRK